MSVLVITASRFGHPLIDRWLDGWVVRRGKPDRLLQGGARGGDAQAKAWCKRAGVECEEFPADWGEDNAGPARNQRMVDACEPFQGACLAFPDVLSRGTWDCYLRAERAGLAVFFAPAVKWRDCTVSGLKIPEMLTAEETGTLLWGYRSSWPG